MSPVLLDVVKDALNDRGLFYAFQNIGRFKGEDGGYMWIWPTPKKIKLVNECK